MQEKTNDPAKRTQPYETSGGFGFYSVNRDYPYAEPRRPQSSLSAFGYTDYSAAFEDLHSLDGFDMGMDDSFRPRARRRPRAVCVGAFGARAGRKEH